jgi:hypothetical protein
MPLERLVHTSSVKGGATIGPFMHSGVIKSALSTLVKHGSCAQDGTCASGRDQNFVVSMFDFPCAWVRAAGWNLRPTAKTPVLPCRTASGCRGSLTQM